MNKQPQFWEKLKKKSGCETEKANHDTIRNRTKDKRKTLEVINSCSETLVPCHSLNKNVQSRTRGEKPKCQKGFVCDCCDTATRNKNTVPRGNTGHDNATSDKAKLDSEYIDNLVRKIKELKNRINVFENQCGFEAAIHNSPLYYYQRETEQIGDYNVHGCQKWQRNPTNIRHSRDDIPDRHKLSNYAKNVSDHQKSIYTTNGQVAGPRLTTDMIQEECSKISKHEKNKSKASIVMALHSTSKNNFVKVNPHPDSKHFQAAAEEFIEQAEELKAKIGYILECCGYNHLSTDSDPSDSLVPSDYNYSLDPSSGEFMDDALSNRDVKLFFGTVSTQYSEILASLMTIEKQIKNLSKHRLSKRLQKTNSKVSLYSPRARSNCISNKVDTHNRSHTSGMVMNQNHSGRDINSFHPEMGKIHSTDVQSRRLRAAKNGNADKNLEPVVMVYEPIHPEYNSFNRVCEYCGQELNSCTGRCSEDSVAKTKREVRKNKNKEVDKTQKYGFVVTYTPDFSPDSDVTISNSREGTKVNKKVKKKILPCLGF